MIINYIKTAIRNLRKKWSFILISVLGLSIGLASFLILISYTYYESNFDNFHKNKENIYRINYKNYEGEELKVKYPNIQPALGNQLKKEFEGIELISRFSSPTEVSVVKSDKIVLNVPKLFYSDEDFFEMFSFELLNGDSRTALKEPNSVVLTEIAAERFFGTESCIGKILEIGNDRQKEKYTITGVVKAPPLNSSLNFEMICSFSTLNKSKGFRNNWNWFGFQTFVKIPDNVKLSTVEENISNVANTHRKGTFDNDRIWEYEFQPLKEIHLKSDFRPLKQNIATQTLLLLKGIAVFIILISWVNYINLSIANSTERAKETGVRKALGAFKKQIISQFFIEAFLVNFLALLLSLIIIALTIKPFSSILELNYGFEMILQPVFGYYLFLIFCVGLLISGTYPAFVLSSFKTIEVLNSKTVTTKTNIKIRGFLLGIQFFVSIVMIGFTVIMIHQTYYMKNQDIGIDIDDKLIIKKPKLISNKLYQKKYLSFKEVLKKETNAKIVSASHGVPSAWVWSLAVWITSRGYNSQQSLDVNGVDTDYLAMYDIKIIAGRGFYENNLVEKNSAIVSEKFIKTFGYLSPEDVIGESIEMETFKGRVFKIIGVFKDYHHISIKNEQAGMIMVPNLKLFKMPRFYSIQLGEHETLNSTIKKSEQVFNQFFPNDNFEYEILRDRYFLQYKSEDKMLNIFFVFSVLAILLACIGVVGLSSFIAFLKTREIAIKKVFGANTINVFWVLSKQFVFVLGGAFVLSVPFIYYFMNKWLNTYPYKIKLSMEHFLGSFLLIAIITLMIIFINLLKALNKQPSDVLRA